jgi:hypothetical protein
VIASSTAALFLARVGPSTMRGAQQILAADRPEEAAPMLLVAARAEDVAPIVEAAGRAFIETAGRGADDLPIAR